MRILLAGGLLVAAAGFACKQKVPEGADTPPQAYPSSAAASRPTETPAGHGAPNPHGGGNPHAPAGGAPAAGAGGQPITGVITLEEGGTVSPTDVLYVMARTLGPDGPASLVAVKKLDNLSADAFPLRFELGAADVMMQGSPFAGPFFVYARLDKDGDPMTKTPADLYADGPARVENGTTDLKLDLATRAAE